MPGQRTDTQRKKIYDSEDAAFPGHKQGPIPALRTVADVERFLHSVVKRKRVQNKYPKAVRYARDGIQVSDGGGTRWARGGGGWVNAPLWARTYTVMLHELAHNLAGTHVEHNWQFAECLLYLVQTVLGPVEAEKLKAQYRAHRVKFRPPRPKRVISPERREALVNQLAAARAVKRGDVSPAVANDRPQDWIDWTLV